MREGREDTHQGVFVSYCSAEFCCGRGLAISSGKTCGKKLVKTSRRTLKGRPVLSNGVLGEGFSGRLKSLCVDDALADKVLEEGEGRFSGVRRERTRKGELLELKRYPHHFGVLSGRGGGYMPGWRRGWRLNSENSASPSSTIAANPPSFA